MAKFTRRDVLQLMAGAIGGGALPNPRKGGRVHPALFVSHGSPLMALGNDDYTGALRAFARAHPEPSAIVVVSAHWQTRGPVRVTASAAPETIHDFGGFPDEMYKLTYPSPGDPRLAERIALAITDAGLTATLDLERGLDHGVWVPLRLAYPKAKIPVVAVSLPRPRTPNQLLKIGVALAPLRREKILLLGSGGVVHNLLGTDMSPDEHAPVAGWAGRFDGWIKDKLEQRDVASLVDWERLAPDPRTAHPTPEHFDPIFAVLGAAQEGDRLVHVYEGFRNATMSMRCFALQS